MGVKMAVPATVGKEIWVVTVRLAHIVTNVKISDVSLQLNIYFHYLLLQLLFKKNGCVFVVLQVYI